MQTAELIRLPISIPSNGKPFEATAIVELGHDGLPETITLDPDPGDIYPFCPSQSAWAFCWCSELGMSGCCAHCHAMYQALDKLAPLYGDVVFTPIPEPVTETMSDEEMRQWFEESDWLEECQKGAWQ
jgi:hypothetical protein